MKILTAILRHDVEHGQDIYSVNAQALTAYLKPFVHVSETEDPG